MGSTERTIFGVVTRIAALGTARTEDARRYRVTVRSPCALLEQRRRSRVFQHLSVPDIVRQVLLDGGYHGASELRSGRRTRPAPTSSSTPRATPPFCAGCVRRRAFTSASSPRTRGRSSCSRTRRPRRRRRSTRRFPWSTTRCSPSRELVAFACSSARQPASGKGHCAELRPRPPCTDARRRRARRSHFERGTEVYATPASRRAPGRREAWVPRWCWRACAPRRTVCFRTTASPLAPGAHGDPGMR